MFQFVVGRGLRYAAGRVLRRTMSDFKEELSFNRLRESGYRLCVRVANANAHQKSTPTVLLTLNGDPAAACSCNFIKSVTSKGQPCSMTRLQLSACCPSKPIPETSITTIVVGVVVVAALYFGREVLVPIALAVLLSFILSPLVRLLQRAYFPSHWSPFEFLGWSFLGRGTSSQRAC